MSLEDLKESNRLLKEENDYVLSVYTDMKTKYDRMFETHQETQKRNGELEAEIRKLQRENEDIKRQLDKANSEKETLDSRQKELKRNFSEKNSDFTKLSLENSKYQDDIKLLKSRIKVLEGIKGETEERHSMDMETLQKELDLTKRREIDLASKASSLEREYEALKEEGRKYRKDYELTRSENEQMIKMVENLEQRVLSMQKKEEYLAKTAKDNKDKVEEAFIQRDRAMQREEQLQKSFDILNSKHREDMNTFKGQYERMLEVSKNKNKMSLEQRDQEISRLQEELSMAHAQEEKLRSENKSIKRELERLEGLDGEDMKKNMKLEEAQRRIADLESQVIQLEQAKNEKALSFSGDKSNLEQTTRMQDSKIRELKSTMQTLKKENLHLSSENEVLKSKIDLRALEPRVDLEEVRKLKETYEKQISKFSDEGAQRIKELEEQLADSKRKEKFTKQETIKLIKTHESVHNNIGSSTME